MHNFTWMKECKQVFEELKKFLGSPPPLSKLEVGEELLLYLVASPKAMRSVLIQVDDKEIQKLIYYTSQVLNNAESRNSKPEKIVYPLIISGILNLKRLLQWLGTFGKMAKYAIKLNKFDLSYRPRSSKKVQVLADFLIKCTWSEDKADEEPIELFDPETTWILYMDGASNFQESGVGLILTNSKGVVIEYALHFSFRAINNQAEYDALLAGLKIAKEFGVKSLRIFIDS